MPERYPDGDADATAAAVARLRAAPALYDAALGAFRTRSPVPRAVADDPATAPFVDAGGRLTEAGRAVVYGISEHAYAGREGAERFFGAVSLARARVLDVGCGAGAYAAAALARGAIDVTGFDASAATIAVARLLVPAGVRFVHAGADGRWPAADAVCDAVLLRLVLPYLNVDAAAAECARVCAPGGVVIALWHTPAYYTQGLAAAVRAGSAAGAAHMLFALASGVAVRLFGSVPPLPRGRTRRDAWYTGADLARRFDRAGFDVALDPVNAGARLARFVARRR